MSEGMKESGFYYEGQSGQILQKYGVNEYHQLSGQYEVQFSDLPFTSNLHPRYIEPTSSSSSSSSATFLGLLQSPTPSSNQGQGLGQGLRRGQGLGQGLGLGLGEGLGQGLGLGLGLGSGLGQGLGQGLGLGLDEGSRLGQGLGLGLGEGSALRPGLNEGQGQGSSTHTLPLWQGEWSIEQMAQRNLGKNRPFMYHASICS